MQKMTNHANIVETRLLVSKNVLNLQTNSVKIKMIDSISFQWQVVCHFLTCEYWRK